jgi:hypothetical protein
MKKILAIIAALLLFLGFGMIHAGSVWVESTGSVFIGIGALYFIVRLLLDRRKNSGSI